MRVLLCNWSKPLYLATQLLLSRVHSPWSACTGLPKWSIFNSETPSAQITGHHNHIHSHIHNDNISLNRALPYIEQSFTSSLIFKSIMSSAQSNQLRWSQLSDDERRELKKMKNALDARNNRRRWKESDTECEELLRHNDKRIAELEQMADKLSRELNGSRSSKSRGSRKWNWK